MKTQRVRLLVVAGGMLVSAGAGLLRPGDHMPGSGGQSRLCPEPWAGPGGQCHTGREAAQYDAAFLGPIY